MIKISDDRLQIFKNIETKIRNHKNIVIFHHIRPDGDCLGSQFGMKNLIKENFPDKNVYAIGDSKDSYSYLDFSMDKLEIKPLDDSLAIIVDANFKERLECREYLDNNIFSEVIRIDHHPNDDDLNASLVWVDPLSPAAAQQIAEIAYALNWKVNPDAATYLFLGIYTDSVRLTTNLTNDKTMFLVSWLYSKGAKKDLIYSEMAKKSLADIKVNAFIQQNMQIKNKVVSFYFTLEDQHKLGINDPLKANRPFSLANIDDNKAWVFFTQEAKDQIRCEFRSSGACVRNVAIKWGGGGHHRASGAQIHDESLISQIIKDLEKEVTILENYDNK
ncbi:bifunctional oligoribonuclease/PAP phosphatase NrnA [Metamycoplasma phocicerebrale]|uniref:Bifunctional oligoribonuclease/PAP phosphatase NrnA n=1 Tax=Metamycoplasma phocicerebrale TaxID=142649 RepID=A0A3Q9VAD3_9BACT|nr:bifunctional oligoribonuclease/PAP phosphatase NrnA [Metamycoplasma phocicerebrale]AZZ65662.1 bifunctional oligoribonuclease/PAP phosphatase NrnA [Metamycoplasma phocicerebrale]